jgi:hypothetical protein
VENSFKLKKAFRIVLASPHETEKSYISAPGDRQGAKAKIGDLIDRLWHVPSRVIDEDIYLPERRNRPLGQPAPRPSIDRDLWI